MKATNIIMTNFRLWRMRKLLAFLLCMGSSILLIYMIGRDEWNTGFLCMGLLAYGIIEELPFMKMHRFPASVTETEEMICIKTNKKSYEICKKDIHTVRLEEMRYGGRWIDAIGYRLIVTTNHKYIFDFPKEEETSGRQLYQIFLNEKERS